MSKVYILGDAGEALSMARIRCKDEDKELQQLLLRNPELLPSEQIDPEDPPRWLIVKREMPVADPATGAERWSVDFLYVDHQGIPTLVECKRCADTRSRREVVAQMLEYAANGQHYWTAAQLHEIALKSNGAERLQLWSEDAGFESSDTFFAAVHRNLAESRVRLVFFLEESPNELRSLVDFLNKQMNATEVLLVEARQYKSPAGTVVVPWLFGFTEEARVAKKESRAAVSGRAERGEEAYWLAVQERNITAVTQKAMRDFIASFSGGQHQELRWVWLVSAILLVPSIMKSRGLLGLRRSGELELYFGYWSPSKYPDVSEAQVQVRNQLGSKLAEVFDIEFSDKQLEGFPLIKPERWTNRIPQIVAAVKAAITAHT